MRETPNPHLAKMDAAREARAARQFHSGFLVSGRPANLILPPLPHLPSPYDRADMGAWKALNFGTAEEHQQTRAMEHLAIITNFNGDPYVAGDQYATAYAAGKRRVFQQIIDIIRFVETTRSDGAPLVREQG